MVKLGKTPSLLLFDTLATTQEQETSPKQLAGIPVDVDIKDNFFPVICYTLNDAHDNVIDGKKYVCTKFIQY